MTPKEFNEKFSAEKTSYLWDNGVYLTERFYKQQYVIKLYSLFDFFVEVWISLHDNNIENVHALENEKDFDGILSTIKLDELY